MAEQEVEAHHEVENINEKKLKDRKVSWAKLRRVDSLNLEAGRVSSHGNHSSTASWARTLTLAFQSVGIVYGDIGTSPLYVFSNTFSGHSIDNKKDIYGVLSLIIYTIVLIPFIKYAFIVLRANDNGNGGTFALYSKICRHANVSLIPTNQPEDRELSNYTLETPSSQLRRAHAVRKKLENSKIAKLVLCFVAIMGTSLIMGDGILTPSISVLSAVGGIPNLKQDAVVGIAIAILVLLFCAQRFGTDKVGCTFAPIILIWFTLIGGTGLFNLFKHDVSVLRALNPAYAVEYLRRNGKQGWKSLGGVFLCITGSEAMFADLGHFNVRAIQISFSSIVLPALVSAYSGQAAYLSKFPQDVGNAFYASLPHSIYWPTFVMAVLAAIIASQAMISGTFSIVMQALALGCFPRVKVVYTSKKHGGQVYIPEVNYFLMIGCVIVTAAFRTPEKIGNAYGIAVVGDMVITTSFVTLVMIMIWKASIVWIALFFIGFGSIELLYVTALFDKFTQGGFLPLVLACALMTMMAIWQYVQRQKYIYELKNKVSTEYLRQLADNPDVHRIPGIGLLYSELVQGIPLVFTNFVSHIPSIHSVVVFVSIKPIPISTVNLEERFLFRQVEPREYRMFRCVVRYGYNDLKEDPKEFEKQLVEKLKEFIRYECYMLEAAEATEHKTDERVSAAAAIAAQSSSTTVNTSQRSHGSSHRIIPDDVNSVEHQSNRIHRIIPDDVNSVEHQSNRIPNDPGSAYTSNRIVSTPIQGAEEEVKFVQRAMDKGVVYLLGEAEVVAERESSILKRIIVNHAYNFLRKNFRQGAEAMAIPKASLLKVGMTYEI